MIRAILYLIATIFIISVLRSIIGIITKGFGDLFNPEQPAPGARPDAPSGGELKKDPVCGTFIAASTSIHKKVGDVTYYFCSTECRDKFKA
jgi:YHS domain-containing protein